MLLHKHYEREIVAVSLVKKIHRNDRPEIVFSTYPSASTAVASGKVPMSEYIAHATYTAKVKEFRQCNLGGINIALDSEAQEIVDLYVQDTERKAAYRMFEREQSLVALHKKSLQSIQKQSLLQLLVMWWDNR